MKRSDNYTIDDTEGFYLAVFGIDGTLEGEGRWKHADLSDRWLLLCDYLFSEKGLNFDHRWPGPLSKIRTKITSANGVGICTFFVDDRSASSVLLLCGIEPVSERETCAEFVESLRNTQLAAAVPATFEPFANVLTIPHRPLMIVVPFPDPDISDQDYDLVRELSLHLASAFVRLNG